ncbi:hypothetical protein CEUSTIGMA_g7688.t1 [Chlamydomonas eustigma]|uniref:DOMON domain-containing protein n=1 Tax=Chlamydomonas eustigma TaxID=1157962 RepID=A0A250XBV5_9CHLO|nr:hypothetical protein CEUSTIGMA_g7688.t1 [Chlamydomonas eustigma]|eukprot:GAX80250.1 hypothetical protein CEUSTIGMA_g7688.t1 [Chlamydomonas eustigma]
MPSLGRLPPHWLSDDAQPWLVNPWHIEDYWSANSSAGLVLDNQQDVTLLTDGVTATQTYTLVQFTRNLDTCERTQDIKIFNDTDQQIVYTYSSVYSSSVWLQNPSTAVVGNTWNGWGTASVRFNPTNFTPANTSNASSYYLALISQDPPDLQGMFFKTNNFNVKAPGDSYRCVNYNIATLLPDQSLTATPFHVIRYGGNASNALFSHAVLYACSMLHAASALGGYNCAQGQPPYYCSNYYAIWTSSTGNVSLPAAAGLPMGNTSYQAFTLMVHYSNPNNMTAVDNSGIMMYYTSALRESNAAVLKLGTATAISNTTASGTQLSLRSTCPAACTQSMLGLSNTPTVVFSAYFHMPPTGISMQTRHVSNGTEIQPVQQRLYWNASYQYAATALPQSRVLLPGDSLVTECNLTYAANSGYFTINDYCLGLVMYFPATNFTDCSTYSSMSPGSPATVQACGPASLYNNFSSMTNYTALQQVGLEQLWRFMAVSIACRLRKTGNLYPPVSTWSLPNYVEPCEQYIGPPVMYYTKSAAATIVGVSAAVLVKVTIALLFLMYYLWSRYGREEDPERQQLMQEIHMRLANGDESAVFASEQNPAVMDQPGTGFIAVPS